MVNQELREVTAFYNYQWPKSANYIYQDIKLACYVLCTNKKLLQGHYFICDEVEFNKACEYLLGIKNTNIKAESLPHLEVKKNEAVLSAQSLVTILDDCNFLEIEEIKKLPEIKK